MLELPKALLAAPLARLLSSGWIEPLLLFRRHLAGSLLAWIARMVLVVVGCGAVVALVWVIDVQTPSVLLDLIVNGLLGVAKSLVGLGMPLGLFGVAADVTPVSHPAITRVLW